jgi:SRSO17 transposase
VLADSLSGESETTFIDALEKLKLNFIVAIRSNPGVWMPKGARVRANKKKEKTSCELSSGLIWNGKKKRFGRIGSIISV